MVVSFKCCTCKKKERKKELNANVKEVVALKKEKNNRTKNFIVFNQVSTICIEEVFLLLFLKNYLLQLNTTISFGMRKSMFSIWCYYFMLFNFECLGLCRHRVGHSLGRKIKYSSTE